MLSDRLLAAPDYDTIRDVKHLELLKRRFGDGALLHCEIMLKDVEESRRITRAIQGHFGDETAQTLDVTVASHLYWPPLANEPLELPPAIARETPPARSRASPATRALDPSRR